jgi:carbamoyl-phosphate synthase large subunit
MVAPVKELEGMGFKIIATRGTMRHLQANGVQCQGINKVLEGRPHIVDAMKNGDVDLVFNTTEGSKALADSKDIRRTALLHHIPYYTTLAGAVAVTRAIRALKAGTLRVAPLQSFVTRAL